MKLIMTVLLSLLLLPIFQSNSVAGNSVYIQQDNQDVNGSIYIKQDGTGNKFGISTSAPFVIDGSNLTVIIKQLGDNNVTDDTGDIKFKGSNMTFDYIATGDSNKLRIDSVSYTHLTLPTSHNV